MHVPTKLIPSADLDALDPTVREQVDCIFADGAAVATFLRLRTTFIIDGLENIVQGQDRLTDEDYHEPVGRLKSQLQQIASLDAMVSNEPETAFFNLWNGLASACLSGDFRSAG